MWLWWWWWWVGVGGCGGLWWWEGVRGLWWAGMVGCGVLWGGWLGWLVFGGCWGRWLGGWGLVVRGRVGGVGGDKGGAYPQRPRPAGVGFEWRGFAGVVELGRGRPG
ncbi:hypothetical protein RA268_27995, partial [Pseudomonas syringae pv. tagetis]